jgi:hypothetical protein
MGSKTFSGAGGRMNRMAQKLRVAKEIADRDFDRLTKLLLKEDKDLLERLAKV